MLPMATQPEVWNLPLQLSECLPLLHTYKNTFISLSVGDTYQRQIQRAQTTKWDRARCNLNRPAFSQLLPT